MGKHVKTETLIDLADGTIAQADKINAQKHLAGCSPCSTEADLFGRVIGLMRADDSFDAPAASLKWTKELFRGKAIAARQAPAKTLGQRIRAVLQVDLSDMKPAFGERSAAAAAQMLFTAGDHSIDIRVTPTDKGFTVKGQIIGDGFEGGSVTLTGGVKDIQAQANELAEFTIANVKAGTYGLVLKKEEREIVLENLMIK